MASYNRSTSAPAVETGEDASVDGFPPVLVLYHPSMELLARNIVDATRKKKLSLSAEASCINAGSYLINKDDFSNVTFSGQTQVPSSGVVQCCSVEAFSRWLA